MIALSSLIGVILGGIIGFFAGIFGASEMTMNVLFHLVVIPVTLGLSLFPLKWVLKKKFKEFKLVMIANEQPAVANQPISPNQT